MGNKAYFEVPSIIHKYLLIKGSSLGGAPYACSESSNNMQGVLVFDCRLSPKWQKIKRDQWDLMKMASWLVNATLKKILWSAFSKNKYVPQDNGNKDISFWEYVLLLNPTQHPFSVMFLCVHVKAETAQICARIPSLFWWFPPYVPTKSPDVFSYLYAWVICIHLPLRYYTLASPPLKYWIGNPPFLSEFIEWWTSFTP